MDSVSPEVQKIDLKLLKEHCCRLQENLAGGFSPRKGVRPSLLVTNYAGTEAPPYDSVRGITLPFCTKMLPCVISCASEMPRQVTHLNKKDTQERPQGTTLIPQEEESKRKAINQSVSSSPLHELVCLTGSTEAGSWAPECNALEQATFQASEQLSAARCQTYKSPFLLPIPWLST